LESFDILVTTEAANTVLLLVLQVRKVSQIPMLVYAWEEWSSRERKAALDAGVDVLVFSPNVRFDEMVAQMQALVRRATCAAPPTQFRVGRICLDMATHTVLIGDKRVDFPEKQYKLLVPLTIASPNAVSYPQLFDAIGYHVDSESRGLKEAMRRLRPPLARGACDITAVVGFGYRLTAVSSAPTVSR
jgi:DNA-binding response OmpR family regulator